jgi:hypothetical protein
MSLLLASFLLAAADPSAVLAPSKDVVQPAPTNTKREKRVCKADESFTGSRFKKKICLTETEWANRASTTSNDLKVKGVR